MSFEQNLGMAKRMQRDANKYWRLAALDAAHAAIKHGNLTKLSSLVSACFETRNGQGNHLVKAILMNTSVDGTVEHSLLKFDHKEIKFTKKQSKEYKGMDIPGALLNTLSLPWGTWVPKEDKPKNPYDGKPLFAAIKKAIREQDNVPDDDVAEFISELKAFTERQGLADRIQ